MNMFICAGRFPLKNKINTTKKAAVKKAFDHSDMDMFAPALQFTGIMSKDEESPEQHTAVS